MGFHEKYHLDVRLAGRADVVMVPCGATPKVDALRCHINKILSQQVLNNLEDPLIVQHAVKHRRIKIKERNDLLAVGCLVPGSPAIGF